MGIFTQAYQAQNPQPQQSGGVFQKTQQNQMGVLPNPYSDPHNPEGTGAQDIADAFKGSVQQVKEGFAQTKNNPTFISGLEGGVKEVAGGVGAVLSPVAPIFGSIGQASQKLGEMSENVSEHLPGSSPESFQQFASSKTGQNVSRVTEDVGNLSTLAGAGASEINPKEIINTVKNTIQGKTSDVVASYIDSTGNKVYTKLTPSEASILKDEVKNVPEAKGGSQIHLESGPRAISEGTEISRGDFIKNHSQAQEMFDNSKANTPQNTAKIQETISPKPTPKEAKLAQSQGRFIQGKEPTLFKAGTADSIAPSEKVIRATDTIQRNIPGADKMDESQLHSALSAKIEQTAETLKPQMKATQIKPETIQKINDDWTALKKSQIEEADATEEPNVRKQQQQFEQRLMKSGNSTMDDLWETRKSYDDGVPENVKKANSMSPESLQNKKQIWLQNRGILTDSINDAQNGMGATSQRAFSDMHDMYNAKEGIMSKTKVDGAKMSKVNQFLKEHPTTAKFLGGATIYEVLKHLGLPVP